MQLFSSRRAWRALLLSAMVATSTGTWSQQADPSVQAYRLALADKDGNPGLLAGR